MSSSVFKILTSVLLIVSITGLADAGTVEILPGGGIYQGTSYFSQPTTAGGIAGKIDFAVYDTQQASPSGIANPGSGQYIYAYQIFCDQVNTDPISFFSIFNIGENAIANYNDIDSQNDGSGDNVDTTDEYFNPSFSKATWVFDNGLLVAGEHSYFLVLSSDHNWTAGSYSFSQPADGQAPIPNPEPATIALMTTGVVLLLRKKKRQS
ncbi:MAG: PEP-CTERM sorting domain-containing protein [Phycisphaerae bacterium]|nr:PEP-CTERM sorting domain-containing protein [Phycisphaerae bacterium]